MRDISFILREVKYLSKTYYQQYVNHLTKQLQKKGFKYKLTMKDNREPDIIL